MNPVFAREAKERFRTRRTLPFLTAWTVAIGLLTYLLYLLALEISTASGLGRLVSTGYVGRFLFQAMVLLLLTAVIFLVPASAAVSIVGERERQTFQLLQVTQLSPFKLVLGKLLSSISYLMILMIVAMPMAAIPLLFGGATVGDVAAALGMLVVTAVMLASVSVWVSSRARGSRGAVAGALSITFLISYFTFAAMGGELLWQQSRDPRFWNTGSVEIVSIWPNPYFGIVDAVIQPYEIRQQPGFNATPFTPFELLLYRRHGVRIDGGGFVEGIGAGRLIVREGRQLVEVSRPPVYVYTAVIYLGISALALWRATKAVTAPGGKAIKLRRPHNATS
jgi:ABC-type transport system involved in multi-copper enzyme maturation permease subunit